MYIKIDKEKFRKLIKEAVEEEKSRMVLDLAGCKYMASYIENRIGVLTPALWLIFDNLEEFDNFYKDIENGNYDVEYLVNKYYRED